MEDIHKKLLVEKRVELKDHICFFVLDVTNYMMAKTIISPEMNMTILSEGSMLDKTYRLLDILPMRGCRAFETFYQAICYYSLWGAADILYPDKAPHDRTAGLIATQRNTHPPHFFQGPGYGSQVNVNLMLNSTRQYEQVLEREWSYNNMRMDHSYSPRAIQPSHGCVYHSPSMQQPYQKQQQYLSLDGPVHQMANLDPHLSDAPRPCLTVTECQDRISKFQVPLNINDYIMLAALEGKANLEDRKVHDILTCMATKAREYFESKISEVTTNERMTPEEAKRRYISMSNPRNGFFTDFRFYQVWGMSHPLVGLNILAFNSQKIMFLDFATKTNKERLQWHRESLLECKKSNDYTFSVILQFEDQTNLTLLSLDYEEIWKELQG